MFKKMERFKHFIFQLDLILIDTSYEDLLN